MLTVSPPLTQLPLFVQSGSLIPVIEPGDRIADGPWQSVTLLSSGTFSETSYNFRDIIGNSAVLARRDGARLTVEVTGPARVTAVAFPWTSAPGEVILNGAPIEPSTVELT